ncbi:MAG: Hypothetical protein AJITA_00743 [Acetilactobacillus jinshanensis]
MIKMFALKTLVIIALFLNAITIDLLKFSKVLDACRSVVKSAKRLRQSIHHCDE